MPDEAENKDLKLWVVIPDVYLKGEGNPVCFCFVDPEKAREMAFIKLKGKATLLKGEVTKVFWSGLGFKNTDIMKLLKEKL